MSMGTASREANNPVQDWINLICAALLFVSPWVLGFSGEAAAARTAWVGGVVIGVIAIAALVQFAEWEEWVTLIVGLAVAAAPWVLGFTAIHAALGACVVLGLIVALASISEIWVVRHAVVSAR